LTGHLPDFQKILSPKYHLLPKNELLQLSPHLLSTAKTFSGYIQDFYCLNLVFKDKLKINKRELMLSAYLRVVTTSWNPIFKQQKKKKKNETLTSFPDNSFGNYEVHILRDKFFTLKSFWFLPALNCYDFKFLIKPILDLSLPPFKGKYFVEKTSYSV
jgi:hypothetical protein